MVAAAAAYRRVLKAVQKHVGAGASKQHFRDFVAAEFRSPAGTEADARERLRLAGDYDYLLSSVHHHKEGVRPVAPRLNLAAASAVAPSVLRRGGRLRKEPHHLGMVIELEVGSLMMVWLPAH